MGDIAAVMAPRERSEWSQDYRLNDYVGWLSGLGYGFPYATTMQRNEEPIVGDFTGLVGGAYLGNSIVFACLMKRFQVFSQARIQYQQLRGGADGDLFGTADLSIVEQPEPGEVTADLLTMAMLDADLAGDWFGVRRPGRIKRLRPDWTAIIVGSTNPDAEYPSWDPDAEVIGYSFMPGGLNGGGDTIGFDATEVAHFNPIRNPLLKYRGVPLPTAALRDIRGDTSATTHKLSFFDNAATPNMVVKFPERMDPKKAEQAIDLFEQEHTGAFNAYRTIYLLGGAEIEVVGKDMKELDFAATQGKGETRVVAAMGLHPAVVPVSEGMQGSTLNTGNFGAARRLVADTTFRFNWVKFVASLQTIVPPPGGARLWYDAKHIPFLAEDVKDAAEVVGMQMTAIRTGTDGGYAADSVVDAVVSGDLRRLRHTGYLPVQVQPIQGDESAGPAASGGPPAEVAWARLPEGESRRKVSALPARSGMVAATKTFWPSSGDFLGETIEAGTVLPANDPLVRAFGSMFAPIPAGHPHGKE